MDNLTNLTIDETTYEDGNSQQGTSILASTCLVGVTIILVNTTTLLAFMTEKKLRTYANRYIINLNMIDLATGLIVLIGGICFALPDDPHCIKGSLVVKDIHNILLLTSNLNIITIAFDRLYAIYFPFKYRINRSKIKTAVTCASPWLVSVAIWIPLKTYLDILQEPENQSFYTLPEYYNYVWSAAFVTGIYFWGPWLIISLVYGNILYKLKKRNSNKSLISLNSPNKSKMRSTSLTGITDSNLHHKIGTLSEIDPYCKYINTGFEMPVNRNALVQNNACHINSHRRSSSDSPGELPTDNKKSNGEITFSEKQTKIFNKKGVNLPIGNSFDEQATTFKNSLTIESFNKKTVTLSDTPDKTLKSENDIRVLAPSHHQTNISYADTQSPISHGDRPISTICENIPPHLVTDKITTSSNCNKPTTTRKKSATSDRQIERKSSKTSTLSDDTQMCKSKGGRITGNGKEEKKKKKWFRGSNKTYLTLSLIILIFVFTWSGYSISTIILAWQQHTPSVESKNEPLSILFTVTYIFKYANSIMNPLAIILSQPTMRVTLRRMIKCSSDYVKDVLSLET
ncbi:uncharacterized protein [Antedon mediterranea]|uniref:uncharacterized protein n=1 Tax=Antedon mediterranea TaxID=105859 RepID=UPI003AF9D9AB